jgi:hypothetical protein
MKLLFNIILLLLGFFLVACDQRPNPVRILEKVNLTIPAKYKLSNFKSDWDVGETTEDYTLLISKEDYQRISKEIEGKIFFQRLDTNKVPVNTFINDIDLKKISEAACWYDNKYFYQIFRPNPGVVITVLLEKDSIMSINYRDL